MAKLSGRKSLVGGPATCAPPWVHRLLTPAMALVYEPGTRVRLLQDFHDHGGLLYRRGHLATVQGDLMGITLLHFDGFEDLRGELRANPSAFGAVDQAPWLAAVPTRLLEPA